MDTNTTAFALDGVDFKIITDGIPAAQIKTYTAIGTFILIDNRRMARLENMPLSDLGIHDQMKIGRIHIGIAKNLVFSQ
jgi:hypothetical protein